jgi:Skp family chaperone for outer membrane proteins
MYKKFSILIYLFVFLITSNAYSNEKIVYLDVNFIMNKSKPAISIIKKIDKIRNKETKNLKSAEEKIKKKNEELKKTKNLISEAEFKDKVAKFRDELKQFEAKKIKTINEINKKRQQELNDFLSLINPLIQDYMKKNSIDIVIDKKNIFIAKSEHDITKDILEIVNNKIK